MVYEFDDGLPMGNPLVADVCMADIEAQVIYLSRGYKHVKVTCLYSLLGYMT